MEIIPGYVQIPRVCVENGDVYVQITPICVETADSGLIANSRRFGGQGENGAIRPKIAGG